MKKIISTLITAAFSTVCLFCSYSDYTFAAGEYTYSQNDLIITCSVDSNREAHIVSCVGTGTSFAIPESIGLFPIISIEENAFSNLPHLAAINIPDSIVSIGDKAFFNCTSLKNIYIGAEVSEIGEYAFSACPAIDVFTVSSGNSHFTTVNNMLYSSDGNTLISYSGSSSAVIPNGTVSIGKAAFFGNTNLTSVNIPETVTNIESYAFSGCLNLQSISMPSSVYNLGEGAFMNCSKLAIVELSENITTIPDECFSMCSKLSTINTSSIRSIGDRAFFSCAMLSGIDLPVTIQNIGTDAIGIKYDIRIGNNIPINGFFISGKKGSVAETYATSNGVDFIDFFNIPYGDIDGNGKVNPIDATLVLVEYSEKAMGLQSNFTYYQTLTGDLNHDGIINVLDASLILSRYASSSIS